MSSDMLEMMRERATQVSPVGIDVPAAVRKGDRRRRMRAVGLAGVAIAAVAAVGIVLLPRVGSPGVDVAGVPSGPREVSWASGSTIHHGDAELDVSPWVVQAYVQTDDGFVFTDPDGGVHLAMASGTEQIGSGDADGRYLRADDSGPGDSGHHVAWIDSSDTTPALVVYDTLAREVVLDTTEHFRAGMGTLRDDDSAFVYAVDGGYVYVRDGEGLSRVNIADGSFEPLATGVEGFDVADVTNGLIAHERPKPVTSFSGEDIPMTMVLGRAYTANGSRIPAESQLLSPDARYVVTDYNDSEQVFEVATGDDVTPSLPGGVHVRLQLAGRRDGGDRVARRRRRCELARVQHRDGLVRGQGRLDRPPRKGTAAHRRAHRLVPHSRGPRGPNVRGRAMSQAPPQNADRRAARRGTLGEMPEDLLHADFHRPPGGDVPTFL